MKAAVFLTDKHALQPVVEIAHVDNPAPIALSQTTLLECIIMCGHFLTV